MDVLVVRGKGSRSEQALKMLKDHYQSWLGKEVLNVQIEMKEDGKNRAYMRTRGGSKLRSVEQMEKYLVTFARQQAARRAAPRPAPPPPVDDDYESAMAQQAISPISEQDDDAEETIAKRLVAEREKRFDARIKPSAKSSGGSAGSASSSVSPSSNSQSESSDVDFGGSLGYDGDFDMTEYMDEIARQPGE